MHGLDRAVAGGAGDGVDDIDALIEEGLRELLALPGIVPRVVPPLPPTKVPVVVGSSSEPSQPMTWTDVPFCLL